MSFLGHYLPRDGYGYATIKIAEALGRLAEGEWQALDMARDNGRTVPGEARWTADGPAVVMTVPEWWQDVDAPRLYGYTMFESTQMPAGRVELINRHAEACIVPCEWCAETFREQGVEVQIHVARWGIDPEDYYPLDRSDHDGPYTFLWSGTPDMRKGWDLAYTAFWAAFGKDPDARLVMHFRELPKGLQGANDPNVEVVEGYFGRSELRRMLEEADCFVFPSRGEGWGLPPREAAATGLPVIVTDWGGLLEELFHWGLPLPVKGVRPAEFGLWDAGTIGEWAEPDLDQLVHWMRWCFDHREEAARWGASAAEWLASNTTWERTARRLCEVVS